MSKQLKLGVTDEEIERDRLHEWADPIIRRARARGLYTREMVDRAGRLETDEEVERRRRRQPGLRYKPGVEDRFPILDYLMLGQLLQEALGEPLTDPEQGRD